MSVPCEYTDTCPSASGWCQNGELARMKCMPFVQTAIKQLQEETVRLKAYLETRQTTGTWERIHEIDGQPTFSFWRCSACHKAHYLEPPNADFCPACGARMMGTED